MQLIEDITELDRTSRWNPTFMMLQLDTRKLVEDLTQTAARLPQNRALNRYRDVLPYDTSRVKLKTASGDKDYINASYVDVAAIKRRYILAQGPLPGTSEDFWRMIWENKSPGIVMLNKIVEKNVIKCHPYWPMGEDEELEFGDFTISNYSCAMRSSFIVRELLLRNRAVDDEQPRIIKQFHFVTWPDFGVPAEPSEFLEFLEEIKTSGILECADTPAIVHCSAGIGRSGTFCLVDSALETANQSQSVEGMDPHGMLLAMRRYRCGLVQTAEQLRFANIAIVYGLHALFPHLVPTTTTTSNENEENSTDDTHHAAHLFEGNVNENGSNDVLQPPPLPPKMKEVPPPKPSRNTTDQQQQQQQQHNMEALQQQQRRAFEDHFDIDPSTEGSSEEEIINLSSSESSDDIEGDLEAESSPLEVDSGSTDDDADEEDEDVVGDSAMINDYSDNEIVTNTEVHPIQSTPDIVGEDTSTELRNCELNTTDAELRRRRINEKKQKTADLVANIKKNMKDSEERGYLPKNFWKYTGIAIGVGSLLLLAYHLCNL